jgi:outer membrane immunogenic protein
MKKFLLAGVAVVALGAIAPAHAADLGRPTYKAPPPVVAPVPIFSWTGCYIGGDIGWGWGRDTISIPNLSFTAGVPLPPDLSIPSASADTKGFLGGGQVGCNYQLAPNWVIGIEGDGSAADIKGDLTRSFSFFDSDPSVNQFVTITGTAHGKTDWLASVTGRLGWTWDRWMIYAKGGVAWAGDKFSADIPLFDEHLETSQTRTGWTVGGGVEWAFWNNWSAKLEYDFYDFGTRSLTLTGTFVPIGGTVLTPVVVPGIDVKQTINAVKFGVNYRFDWGKGKAPIVARY